MMMHKTLNPRDDIDRLFVSRKEGGRGFASIEDSVDTPIRCLEDDIKKSQKRLIIATRNRTNNTKINKTTITRKQKMVRKKL